MRSKPLVYASTSAAVSPGTISAATWPPARSADSHTTSRSLQSRGEARVDRGRAGTSIAPSGVASRKAGLAQGFGLSCSGGAKGSQPAQGASELPRSRLKSCAVSQAAEGARRTNGRASGLKTGRVIVSGVVRGLRRGWRRARAGLDTARRTRRTRADRVRRPSRGHTRLAPCAEGGRRPTRGNAKVAFPICDLAATGCAVC